MKNANTLRILTHYFAKVKSPNFNSIYGGKTLPIIHIWQNTKHFVTFYSSRPRAMCRFNTQIQLLRSRSTRVSIDPWGQTLHERGKSVIVAGGSTATPNN